MSYEKMSLDRVPAGEHKDSRVLIVDDDRMLAESVAHALKVMELQPILAGGAVEALDLLRERQDISLVLLDWMMPGRSGLEMLSDINAIDDPPPVIMMTAKMTKEDVVEALSAGAKDYLMKPVDLNVLRERIYALLKKDPEAARRRAAKRKPASFKAQISVAVLDVSETGAAVESSFPLPEGAIFFLESADIAGRIDLPRTHRFSLRVANCAGTGNKYKVGAQFIGLTVDERERLRKACMTGRIFM